MLRPKGLTRAEPQCHSATGGHHASLPLRGDQGIATATAPAATIASMPPTTQTTAHLISNDKNLMPSMVVKQQRSQQNSLKLHRTAAADDQQHPRREEAGQVQAAATATATTLDEILLKTREAIDATTTATTATTATTTTSAHGRAGGELMFDQDGLVLPRRVPHHHQAPGGDGQQPATIRDLNRELKFNQVRGLRLLDQKSELKRAMEKLETNRRRKEAEQERLTRRTSLELRLEERAQRIAARESGASSQQAAGEQQAPC